MRIYDAPLKREITLRDDGGKVLCTVSYDFVEAQFSKLARNPSLYDKMYMTLGYYLLGSIATNGSLMADFIVGKYLEV